MTIFGDGEQTRDYVYVGDVVAANMAVTGAELWPATGIDDRGFNVGTGVETSVNRLAEEMMAVSGRRVEVKYAPARPGELLHSSLDNTKLRGLGWEPGTSLSDGLRNTYNHIAAQTTKA